VLIVGLCLPLALRNKSFLRIKATPTTRSAAYRAVKPGNHSVMETTAMATDHNARCFPQSVPNAARIAKYLSNPVKADRSIAATAILRSERIGNNS